MPIRISGMIAMIGARKMTSSRIRIRRNVAAPTMASALLPDWVLSSASAADPVTPSLRPVEFISGFGGPRMGNAAGLYRTATAVAGGAAAPARVRPSLRPVEFISGLGGPGMGNAAGLYRTATALAGEPTAPVRLSGTLV